MRCDYVNITGLALAHVNSVAAAPDVYAPPLGANLAEAPALPGKEPKKWTDTADAAADDIATRIRNLGSPAVSELIDYA